MTTGSRSELVNMEQKLCYFLRGNLINSDVTLQKLCQSVRVHMSF